MITHISDIKLQTVSIEGVKQVYRDVLSFPIKKETASYIQFEVTPYTTISFQEVYEPIAPAHFAFEISYSKFHETKEIRSVVCRYGSCGFHHPRL